MNTEEPQNNGFALRTHTSHMQFWIKQWNFINQDDKRNAIDSSQKTISASEQRCVSLHLLRSLLLLSSSHKCKWKIIPFLPIRQCPSDARQMPVRFPSDLERNAHWVFSPISQLWSIITLNKCRKRDIDASGLCVKDIQDIPGLMDIPDLDRRSF